MSSQLRSGPCSARSLARLGGFFWLAPGSARSYLARVLSVALALAWAARAAAEPTEQAPLDEGAVVALVRKQNPTLRAALLALESARQSVLRLDAQYTPVVLLDGSASDITTPSLYVTGVSRNRVRRVDVGAELRKHLVWGTDLGLRLGANVQENRFNRPPIAGLGGTGSLPGGVTGGLLPSGKFGPGYGVLAKLSLKQPLLRGLGRDVAESELNAARVQRTAAEHSRDRIASELLRDALGAYWELWYADTALGIQEASRGVAKKQRDDAQARADTGGLAPVEVLAFDTQVASREEDVAAAAAERTRVQLELARLLGSEHTGALSLSDGSPTSWLPAPAQSLEARALAQSAELRERASALELARVRARTAAEPQRQRLDLDSYVQVQGLGNQDRSDAFEQFGRFEAVSAFVGLTYEAPVTGNAERAAAAKARADVEQAEQELHALRQRVQADVRKALDRAASQARRVELAEQTRAIAERQLVAEQARFQNGAGTTLEVIVAEDRLRAAQLRVARARADLVQTVVGLEHLTGQLIERWAARSPGGSAKF